MQRSTAHAEILELVDDGLEADEIAVRMELHPTAVQPLLRIARANLAALSALDDPSDGEPELAREDRPDHQRRH